MRHIFLYQFRANTTCLTWILFAALTVCASVMFEAILPYEEVASRSGHGLAALQVVLLMASAVQALYCPYLASQMVTSTQRSGLVEWWLSSGIAPWKVALLQSLSILFCLLAYQVFIVLPLVLWLQWGADLSGWQRLFEQIALYLMSGELLVLFTIFLASMLNPLIAFLVASGTWFLTAEGATLTTEWIRQVPNPLAGPLHWIWGILPRFDLYHRPLALIYKWPPLSWNVWGSLSVYLIVYTSLLLVGCDLMYRPKYVR